MKRLAVALASAVALVALPISAAADARVAVVIGNDVGRGGDARLRYAQSDARRIADVLATVGGLSAENTIVLLGRSADEVREALGAAHARLASTPGDGLLFVYYSGHADVDALHLGPTALPLRELRVLLRDSPVATRVLVIDACRSGALTYLKGGPPGGALEATVPTEPNPRGFAIVTSSAAGEDAQESDELKASFFTHHLASALVGAADANRDGAVTLAEAFSYAARNTVGSTALTWAGPQHPTFRVDLGGRGDLVLSRPRVAAATAGTRLGQLAIVEPGSYFIRRQGETGLIAEVSSEAVGRPLALPAGRYEVIRRWPDHLLTGTFVVDSAASTAVNTWQMRRADFGRAVRKGGTARMRAFGIYGNGGLRGPLLGLGGAAGAGLGARLDVQHVLVTGALDLAVGSIEGVRGTRLSTRELSLRAGAFRAIDTSRFTLAVGAEVGIHRLGQTASDQPLATPSYAASVGPSLFVEVPIGRRWFAWLQMVLPAYLVSVEDDDHVTHSRAIRITYRAAIAAGGYL